MQVGIVGYSGVGKTTLFNTLTGLAASTGYGAKQVNTGVIDVPDERVDKLTEICQPKKTIYAKITFTDVPGQAPGSGGALSPQMLQELRNMDALAHVVRAFSSDMHVNAPTPIDEIIGFQDELKLADQVVIEKRLDRVRREGKAKEKEREVLEKCLAHLEEDKPLRDLELHEHEMAQLSGFRFLSQKPTLVVFNVDEDGLTSDDTARILDEGRGLGFDVFAISAALEEEIQQLDPEEQEVFLEDLGLTDTARDRFIRAAYGMLQLISFLTSGPDEVRAWTIKKGFHAKRAARAIHSDLERGFIRTKVITFEDFVTYGSEAACRDKGAERVEGKDYLVQDGDILHILANV